MPDPSTLLSVERLVESFDTEYRALTEAVKNLREHLSPVTDDAVAPTAVQAACNTLAAASDAFQNAAAQLRTRLLDLHGALTVLRLMPVLDSQETAPPTPSNFRKMAGLDSAGVLVLAGLCILGEAAGHFFKWGFGFGVALGGTADVVLLLVLMAVHADTSYIAKGGRHWRELWFWKRAYEFVVPTKAFALVVLALLFVTIGGGYALGFTSYELPSNTAEGPTDFVGDAFADAQHTKMANGASPSHASEHLGFRRAARVSFLTLATFDGPEPTFPAPLQRAIICELVSSVLLIVGVFGLAVNRLSDS